MSDDQKAKPKKKGFALLMPILLLALGASGGFAAVAFGGLDPSAITSKETVTDKPSFVPLDPITVVLGGDAERRFLRFSGEVEVKAGKDKVVTSVMPRISDVLNTYLRSVSIADVENPAAMLEIRSQILRRLQLVVGDGVIEDLLITEYVVN